MVLDVLHITYKLKSVVYAFVRTYHVGFHHVDNLQGLTDQWQASSHYGDVQSFRFMVLHAVAFIWHEAIFRIHPIASIRIRPSNRQPRDEAVQLWDDRLPGIGHIL